RLAGRAERSRGIVVELAAPYVRQVLVEQSGEEPRKARLRLAALTEEDDVLTGDDRVLECGQDRVVEADDPRDDRAILREPTEQVGAKLLLDGPADPARSAQLPERGWER